MLGQIRNGSEEVPRTLEARVAASAAALRAYVRRLRVGAPKRPAPEVLAARVRARGAVRLPEPSERSVCRLRDHGE